jgi:hypothetical protein
VADSAAIVFCSEDAEAVAAFLASRVINS